MAEIKYWIWLSALKNLNAKTRLLLLEHFASPERIYYAEAEEYHLLDFLTRSQCEALEDKNLDGAEKIMEDCAKVDARIITIADGAYPARLRAISDPPTLLYTKGVWPDFDSEPAVAVIGSRRSSPYGIRISEKLGYEMAKGGAYVVSGLAAGGDAAAHRGALMAGKKTAAVLGGGVDVRYPAENRKLYDDILLSGVLISEYPPGTEAHGYHFLERNRIISGLSVAVVVVEAALRSGTQNTVRHAVDQGRDVYAVPGPVDAPLSQGCNRILQEGAGLVTCGWDVLRDLQGRFPRRIDPRVFDLPPSVGRVREVTDEDDAADTAHKRRAKKGNKATAAEEKAAKQIDNQPEKEYIELKGSGARERFTDDQINILLFLSDKPMNVDDIAENTQIPVRRVLSALTFLEIDKLVRQESGNRYTLNAVISDKE